MNAETDLCVITFGTELTNFVHDKLTPVQTGPGVHPASSKMGIGSFSGVKRLGCSVNDSPSSSAEVKERVQLHLHFTSVLSWHVKG
jgi:hypothetical protein